MSRTQESKDDKEMFDFLGAYINSGMSTTSTANELDVHRSTVINRLNRLKDEYDIDLKKSDTLLGIMLMLNIDKYEEIFRNNG